MNGARRTNTIALCTEDRSSSSKGGTVNYTTNFAESKTCSTIWYVKVPINEYNVVFQEIFKRFSCTNNEGNKIIKLNFLTLCGNSIDTCNSFINFEIYQHVKMIEFAGHIGSMKVVFELLHKLPSVRQIVFCINDKNVKCENEDFMQYTNDDIKEVADVDKLKIWTSFEGDSHMDLQMLQMGEKNWRMDEIFRLSQLAIPNVRRLEINLSGNGNTYDKVQKFINEMPCLKGNYSAEISGGKLTVVRQPASAASAGTSRPRDKINATSNALKSIKHVYKQEELNEGEQISESSSEHNLHLSTPVSSSNAEGGFNLNSSSSFVVEGTIGAGSCQSHSQVQPSCTEKTIQGTVARESEDEYCVTKQCNRETMEPSALSMDSDGDLRLKMLKNQSRPMPKAPPPPILTPGFTFSKSAVHEPGDIGLSNRWTYRESTSTETSANRESTGSDEPEESIDTKAKKIKDKSETSSEHNLLRSSHYQGSNHSRHPLSRVSSTEEMEIGTEPIKRKRTTEEENQYYEPKQFERAIMEPQGLALNPDEDLREKLLRMRDPLPPRRTASPPPSVTTRRIISSETAGHYSRDRDLNNQRKRYRENRDRTKTAERTSNKEPFHGHEAESPICTHKKGRNYEKTNYEGSRRTNYEESRRTNYEGSRRTNYEGSRRTNYSGTNYEGSRRTNYEGSRRTNYSGTNYEGSRRTNYSGTNYEGSRRTNYSETNYKGSSSREHSRSYESRYSYEQSSYDNQTSKLPYNNMYRGGGRGGGSGRGDGRGRGRDWDGLGRGGGCANQYRKIFPPVH